MKYLILILSILLPYPKSSNISNLYLNYSKVNANNLFIYFHTEDSAMQRVIIKNKMILTMLALPSLHSSKDNAFLEIENEKAFINDTVPDFSPIVRINEMFLKRQDKKELREFKKFFNRKLTYSQLDELHSYSILINKKVFFPILLVIDPLVFYFINPQKTLNSQTNIYLNLPCRQKNNQITHIRIKLDNSQKKYFFENSRFNNK
jgi:hypothetical protein